MDAFFFLMILTSAVMFFLLLREAIIFYKVPRIEIKVTYDVIDKRFTDWVVVENSGKTLIDDLYLKISVNIKKNNESDLSDHVIILKDSSVPPGHKIIVKLISSKEEESKTVRDSIIFDEHLTAFEVDWDRPYFTGFVTCIFDGMSEERILTIESTDNSVRSYVHIY